jgi:DNA repair protein RecO (recombination protein O)
MAEKSDATVLRKYDFSETSQILHLFTRDAGKVRLIAKGVKRKNRAFEGVPDLLDIGSACWIERRGRAGLSILTEWRQVRTFPGLRSDLEAGYCGLYLAELLDALTEEFDPHPALFDALPAALDSLTDPAGRTSAVLRWQGLLLREAGLMPVLGECVSCGREPDWDGPVHFSSGGGGLVCRDCEPHLFEKRLVSPAAVDALLSLENEDGLPAAGRAEAADLMSRHFRWLMGREPQTERFVGEIIRRDLEPQGPGASRVG